MSFKDTPLKEVPTTILLEWLTEGWRPSHSGVPQEFVQRWGAALQAHVEVRRAGDNILSFVTHFDHICLRAMHEVPCCVVGGDADLNGGLTEFIQRDKAPDQMALVLALSAHSYEQVRAKLPDERCVRLAPDEVKGLLKNPRPIECLKQSMCQQVPRRALLPYNINIPAEGGMFFGRVNLVSRLAEETLTSFAIAGPGRIGKTSLLRRYKAQALRDHTRQSATRYFISLYNETPESTARYLAMNIDPSRRSHRVVADTLIDFLRYQKSRHGASLELLLDEVDNVCRSDAFENLAEAAKNGLCRLVMCGRGGLLKAMLGKSPLEGRAELIRVEPLDVASARGLVLKPLADLGFRIEQPEQLTDHVLSLTGRQPYFIQHICKSLAEAAIEAHSDAVTPELLRQVKSDFMTAQFFTKSIVDLDEPRTRLIGLCLVAGSERSFTIQSVQEVARREGMQLPLNATLEVCNDLVINNVLAWDGGAYVLANEGLPFFARQIGYLDQALAESREALKARR